MSDMPAAAAEIDLEGAVEAPLPGFIEPMLATLATKAFDDPDWLFEIKWDGYRVQAVVRDGGGPTSPDAEPRRRERTSGACSRRRRGSPPATAIVDGEVVALDEDGAPDFRLLQEAISELARRAGGERRPAAARLPGVRPALPRRPLAARASRSRIASGCSGASCARSPRVRFASHVEGDGRGVLRRRPGSAASRGSWPSSAARATSRAAGRRPG